jgi:hypothetical protein
VFGELIEFDLGEAPLADTEKASKEIAETIRLPLKATLRMKGAYRAVKPDQYLPIIVQITRMSGRTAVTYADGTATAVKQGDLTYSFTADVVLNQSRTGEFDLVVRAGEQFIAHGKVVITD